MPGTRRQGRPNASMHANTVNNDNNIPNTRTMGNEKLRAFIHRMDIPDSFRQALEDDLGIPSIRTRLHPPQPFVISQRVGNVAQRRRDMVPIGIRYANPSPSPSLSLSLSLFNIREKKLII